MCNTSWKSDLNPEAVQREAQANVKPRVPLPNVGQSVTVVFTSEPRLVHSSQSGLDRDFFVADVDDGSGIQKQIICSRCIRQHLAAMEARGDIKGIVGIKVNISARILPQYVTSSGRVVDNAKIYDVTLLNSTTPPVSQHMVTLFNNNNVPYDTVDDIIINGVEVDPGPLPITNIGTDFE